MIFKILKNVFFFLVLEICAREIIFLNFFMKATLFSKILLITIKGIIYCMYNYCVLA